MVSELNQLKFYFKQIECVFFYVSILNIKWQRVLCHFETLSLSLLNESSQYVDQFSSLDRFIILLLLKGTNNFIMFNTDHTLRWSSAIASMAAAPKRLAKYGRSCTGRAATLKMPRIITRTSYCGYSFLHALHNAWHHLLSVRFRY